jgi:quercetin dioxygenase-like cupin family protein
MNYLLLNRDELPADGPNREFEGYRYGDTAISFIWVDLPPGAGPRRHRHPYAEILLIQEGQGRYTVSATTRDAGARQVVLVPPQTPHQFVNAGPGPLRQIDIHRHPRFVTEWLED